MDNLECSNILGHNKVQPDLVFFQSTKLKLGQILRKLLSYMVLTHSLYNILLKTY